MRVQPRAHRESRRAPTRTGGVFALRLLGLSAALVASATPVGCGVVADEQPAMGEPLAGLGEPELGRFRAGHALFDRIFTPEDGLGPLFNENQCSACHTSPVTGGTGDQFVEKATRFTPPDRCELMVDEGGENVRLQATPVLRAHGVRRQDPPLGATEHARFQVPYLFGLGLIEGIPEADIVARADPDDRDGDGISGRVGRDPSGLFGRFGRKGDVATIRGFTESALLLEMGLTSARYPDEGAIVSELARRTGIDPAELDPTPDPDVDAITVERLTDYVRFLAAPPRQLPEDPDERRFVEEGEGLFHAIGCASCHTPTMRTGPNGVPSLDRKNLYLYSDLLLHDLGPELAGTCGPAASPSEYRTEPLMGLGRRRIYLHDGRAHNLFDAIRVHGGEAEPARDAFNALDRLSQEALVRFLRTL